MQEPDPIARDLLCCKVSGLEVRGGVGLVLRPNVFMLIVCDRDCATIGHRLICGDQTEICHGGWCDVCTQIQCEQS